MSSPRNSSDPAGIAELRIRLEEAEDTLRAIRAGEVDGLVVAGPQGNQIFSLQGAEHPYRLFIEQMNEGAVTISADGIILFHNRQFIELAGCGTILGQELASIPDIRIRTLLESFLTRERTGVIHEELAYARDGGERTLKFVANWLDAGDRMAVLVSDVSEARERETSLRRLNEKMETQIQERTAALEHTIQEVRDARRAAVNMMEDAVTAASALERANRDLELQIVARRQSDLAHRRLATVVEQAAESIIITDPAGLIEYVNPAFEQISGYTSAEDDRSDTATTEQRKAGRCVLREPLGDDQVRCRLARTFYEPA